HREGTVVGHRRQAGDAAPAGEQVAPELVDLKAERAGDAHAGDDDAAGSHRRLRSTSSSSSPRRMTSRFSPKSMRQAISLTPAAATDSTIFAQLSCAP